MIDSLINELYEQRYIYTLMIVISLFFSFTLAILSSTFVFKKNKLSIFSIIYGLDSKRLTILAISLSRFILIIVLLIIGDTLNISYFFILFIYSLIFLLIFKNFKVFGKDLLINLIIFAGIFIEKQLFNYYLNVYRQVIYAFLTFGVAITVTLLALYSLFMIYEKLFIFVKKINK